MGQPCTPTITDRDGDCISDEFEHSLLQRFAPVYYTDDAYIGQVQYVGIPVNASWFMAHANLAADGQVILNRPSAYEALNYLRWIEEFPGTVGARLRLPFMPNGNPRWGYSDIGQPRSWSLAIAFGDGVYGRVWRPFPAQYPNIFSVQYYMLLTWNQPDNCGTSFGEHDGDIIGVDYGVDVSDLSNPIIVHAIYHNHGRQILCTRDAIRFENGHPAVFMEQQGNEPWPNADGRIGWAGWPNSDGYAVNWLFEFGDNCGDVDPRARLCGFSGGEEAVVRGHSGQGLRYPTFNVRNLGEAYGDSGAPTRFFPLADADAEIFLRYAGKWGVTGDPPDGPAFQSNGTKMWNRDFDDVGLCAGHIPAPYSVGNPNPIYPDLDATMRFGDEPFNGCVYDDTEDPGYLYFHCNTYFLPVAYVGPNVPNAPHWGGDGRRLNPFRIPQQGFDHVASYGVLRLYSGTIHTGGPITVSKPMTIEPFGGPVTIQP